MAGWTVPSGYLRMPSWPAKRRIGEGFMPSLRRDGTALFYEDARGREPPILLVHGWCCDHTYLDPQFGHFASRGHRVVAVDLRAHGQSDMCGRPLRSKRNLQERCGPWSGADMCSASAAAR